MTSDASETRSEAAFRMRTAGHTWVEIARSLGYSLPQTAAVAVFVEMKNRQAVGASEQSRYRREARLDALMRVEAAQVELDAALRALHDVLHGPTGH